MTTPVFLSIAFSATAGWASLFAALTAWRRGRKDWLAYWVCLTALSWFYSNAYMILGLTDIDQGDWSRAMIWVSPFAFLYAWITPALLWTWDHRRPER